MLQIQSFLVNFVQEYTFLISSGGEAALIDCGASTDEEWQQISEAIKAQGLTLRHHWLTHAHFDHVFGANYVFQEYGVKPTLHKDDLPLYEAVEKQTRTILGQPMVIRLPEVEATVTHGDVLTLGNLTFEVIHTPGHTPGGINFYCASEKVVFTGDSLFRYEIGRTDLVGGDEEALIRTIRERLLTLPTDVKAYPGHGPATVIADEKRNNPYFAL